MLEDMLQTQSECWDLIQHGLNYIKFKNNFSYIWDNLLFKGTLSGPKQFLATESTLRIIKNAFLFHLKSGLIRKIRNISKFLTSQSGWQTIATDILLNISRN